MKGMDFIEKINDLDDDLLAAAAKAPIRKVHNWSSYAAVAACICFLAGAGMFTMKSFGLSSQNQLTLVSFYMDETTYESPDLNSYIRYNLVSPADAAKCAEITVPVITADDLGEKMGSVKISINNKSVNCSVYHYNKFPEADNICIIELPGKKYQLYVEKYDVQDEIN